MDLFSFLLFLRQIRTNILGQTDRNSTKNQPRSTKIRRKFILGRFLAPKAVSGTRRDAFGTSPGRAKARPGSILGTPGRAEGGREAPKGVPRTVSRRSRARPDRRRRAGGTTSTVGRASGAIFSCFCFVARKLRCAPCTSFYNVLLASNEMRSDRARAANKLENPGVSAPKIEFGSPPSEHRGRFFSMFCGCNLFTASRCVTKPKK